MSRPYVLHFCKDSKCDTGWLAPDMYDVRSRPPRHLYCADCVAFEGRINGKDAKKVASGKILAAKRKRQKQLKEILKGIL